MGNEHQTIHYNSSDINSAMPSETPLPIRLAQTLGITSSLILSGMTLSTSLTTVPRLLESPPTLLLQHDILLPRLQSTRLPPLLLPPLLFLHLLDHPVHPRRSAQYIYYTIYIRHPDADK